MRQLEMCQIPFLVVTYRILTQLSGEKYLKSTEYYGPNFLAIRRLVFKV